MVVELKELSTGDIVEIDRTPRHIIVNNVRGIVKRIVWQKGDVLIYVAIPSKFVNHYMGHIHKNHLIARLEDINKVIK